MVVAVFVPVMAVLVVGHYLSGYLSLIVEYCLYFLAAAGLPLTVAMHRSLQVLVSHLLWVAFGAKVLGTRLRPFFTPVAAEEGGGGLDASARPPGGSDRWLTMGWRCSNWAWWVVGGWKGLFYRDQRRAVVSEPSIAQQPSISRSARAPRLPDQPAIRPLRLGLSQSNRLDRGNI